ncbi:gap junction Cx32.2 protein-like [Xiphias gladius]|uniref:gap junction Cx32.2 protein-like n=1 Tax=Xiphias gladius TaxID=8245 RepID=UPI001A988910|nr:gap junction Cx32.2 protein-like [Xiphias gladius]XP_039981563.1 gap junction Cx32.2 protein-like [Xiphias gladius]XP_039981564.1 gap junction Cx32.2 protein-like [Xiphias gladius]
MGDWSYLSTLLDKVQSHSTVVGKIWMSVLFLFRIFVLGTAADKVWGDEVTEFYCETFQPGCQHACYNWMFPISYVHYWVLQITFVSTPTLVYLGHAVHIIHKEKRMMEAQRYSANGSALKPRYTDERGKVKIKGILFCTYMIQLVSKILLEVGFTVGQFYIFGPVVLVSLFKCTTEPCAVGTGAQCYISRPTEKTIFIIFMLVVSGISVLLNIIEIIYLLCNKRREARKKHLAQEHVPSLQQYHTAWGGLSLSPLPGQGLTDLCNGDKHIDSTGKEKHT